MLIILFVHPSGHKTCDHRIARAYSVHQMALRCRLIKYLSVFCDQNGTFAGSWIAENKNGRTFFNSMRANLAKHQMETVGAELRRNMLWGNDTDPDTASN